MLAGLERDVHSDGGGQLPGPDAGCKHDGLGLDVAALGLDTGHLAVPGNQLVHCDTLDDASTPGSSALGQRHRRVDRRCLAVVRDIESADEVVDVEERPHGFGPVEVDHLRDDITRLRHRRPAQDLLPALVVGGDRDGAGGAVPRCLAGFVLEFLVETGRVRCQRGEAVGRLEL